MNQFKCPYKAGFCLQLSDYIIIKMLTFERLSDNILNLSVILYTNSNLAHDTSLDFHKIYLSQPDQPLNFIKPIKIKIDT